MSERLFYRYGDLPIAAEFPLAALPRADRKSDGWTAQLGAVQRPPDLPCYHTWCDHAGEQVVSFRRHETSRLVDYGRAARFAIDAEKRTITCEPGPSATMRDVGQLLAHDVLPLVTGLEQLTLHGSAAVKNGQAIAFAGASGSGKSTLVLRLAQRGWELLTDDVMIVDTRSAAPLVVPMEMPIRLWSDAVESLLATRHDDRDGKRTIAAHDAGIVHAQRPAQLRAVFLVSEAGYQPLARIEPGAALAALLALAFVLETDEPQSAQRMFRQVSEVVRTARVYQLPAPPQFAELDSVLDAVIRAALD